MKLPQPPTVSDARCVAGARLWRYQSRTRLTVAVKCTFAFDPTDPSSVALVDARALPDGDVDFALQCTSAGVVMRGHAYAAGGVAVSDARTSLTVERHGAKLVDKVVVVVGDLAGAGREPFTKMPLEHARTVGGHHVPENPIGTSYGPNLIDPRDPSRPACFDAIPSSWPARARSLRGVTRGELEGAHNVLPSLPDDFSFGFFQPAPMDQRAPAWRGDEKLVLGGVRPDRAMIELALPTVTARIRVTGTPSPQELEATCDLLLIEADTLHVSCAFRADVDVTDATSARDLRASARVDWKTRPVWSFAEADETMIALSRPPARSDAPPTEPSLFAPITEPPPPATRSPQLFVRSDARTLPSPRKRR